MKKIGEEQFEAIIQKQNIIWREEKINAKFTFVSGCLFFKCTKMSKWCQIKKIYENEKGALREAGYLL